MICPKCHSKTQVIDTRVRKTVPHRVYRMRQCLRCGREIPTLELPKHHLEAMQAHVEAMQQTLEILFPPQTITRKPGYQQHPEEEEPSLSSSSHLTS